MERSTRIWDPHTAIRVVPFVGRSTIYALPHQRASVHAHTGHGTPIQVLIAQTGYHALCQPCGGELARMRRGAHRRPRYAERLGRKHLQARRVVQKVARLRVAQEEKNCQPTAAAANAAAEVKK